MGRFSKPPPLPIRKNGPKKDLSFIIRFDDLTRSSAVLNAGCEVELLKLVRRAKEFHKKWKNSEEERLKLVAAVAAKDKEILGKEFQIKQARAIFEREQKARQRAEAEKDQLHKNLNAVVELLNADTSKGFDPDTLERIKNVRNQVSFHGSTILSPGNEKLTEEPSFNSICDASDLSFEESRNYLSPPQQTRQRKSYSIGRSNLGLVATTTVTVDKDGIAHAESVIESHPMAMTIEELKRQRTISRLSREKNEHSPNRITVQDNFNTPNSSTRNVFSPVLQSVKKGLDLVNLKGESTPNYNERGPLSPGPFFGRQHELQRKKLISIDNCYSCDKRIKFGKNVMKCRACSAVFHVGCDENLVSKPCTGGSSAKSPIIKNERGYLVDFVPDNPPMVPVILEACIREIEARGLLEIGLYRIEGSHTEATELLNKLLTCKVSPPRLGNVDINVITSCVKKFLRNLWEPIVPHLLWNKFVAGSHGDIVSVIEELPRANLDTLGFLILHLKLVAQHSEINKMTANNLSTIMGPTIVGNLSSDPASFLSEAEMQKRVMMALMDVPTERWKSLIYSRRV